MKYILLLILTSCTSNLKEVDQVCEVSCTECKFVELKCDNSQKKDKKELAK